ncbi:class I adenylate-forming enzyme family protein [Bradyrhizobium vignae]|uniref:Acyl-CoA synthetase (AMP-forming)/AMP-acid ligase II n=1 Tax=Bradyrhizobium vignae TaxID=1549949 RepID=A0A2U3Q9Z0_9BRAD|nr:class I adenylate-forming enzyme family protein [Bradyrhizobium vignae]SPP98206.1 Acyl-CoA synthetase (AMP-forming)/AMP-acid ligase II [Bradyrhizobium vignae]
MTPASSSRSQLHDRVTKALRRIEALESAYETTTVGQLVSMRGRTHPSTVAIDFFERGERATYSDMECWSNKYAHALRALGVLKGDRIGVILPNRIEFPILWFAIAKLGAVLVPVNVLYTPREIEYVLSDTQAKFAIVDESAWPVFSAMDPWPQDLAKERVILVGQPSTSAATTLDKLLKGVDDSPVDEDVRANDLLIIAYTSGTTGFPKGCMLTHDYFGVGSYAAVNCDFQSYRRYLSASPFFYGNARGNLLKAYRLGGTLYVAQQPTSSQFIGWIKKYRIEWCHLPELIARHPEATAQSFTSLKQVGQPYSWSPDTVRQFRKQCGVRSTTGFGMTEIGYGTTMPDIEEMDGSGSVGIRSPFRVLRLVNEEGGLAPVGAVGELWVKGRAIFKGYWNRPEANAAAFEGEWFKTGDLLRRDELGFYWFIGRKKDMIRRAPDENISAHEVETIIREISEIADVAAVPVPDEERGEEVKIFVELKEGLTAADLPVERIIQHARTRLAVFKVPRYIAFTPALPRTTSSNKVVKRELVDVSDPVSGAYDSEEKRWR